MKSIDDLGINLKTHAENHAAIADLQLSHYTGLVSDITTGVAALAMDVGSHLAAVYGASSFAAAFAENSEFEDRVEARVRSFYAEQAESSKRLAAEIGKLYEAPRPERVRKKARVATKKAA